MRSDLLLPQERTITDDEAKAEIDAVMGGPTDSDLMALKNGPIVRESAVALACDLERRGHIMTADAGVLKVSNGSALTADDRAAIVRDRQHLIAIAEYCQSGAADATPR